MEHKRVLDLIKIFGLRPDYDQWEISNKNWIRVKDYEWKSAECIIIYKYDSDGLSCSEREILKLLHNYLIFLGEYKMQLQLQQLIGVK